MTTFVLTCGGASTPEPLQALPGAAVGARPGKPEVNPPLTGVTRLIVVGGGDQPDADLAAVLTRLLRTERLHIELAYVAPRPTPATRVWSLASGQEAALRAGREPAVSLPLVRDDAGQALVARASLAGPGGAKITGESYVDSVLLFSGNVDQVLIEPTLDGLRAALPRRWRQRWVAGRAVQTGSTGMALTRDGVTHDRVVNRSTFYRHTQDWLLVR